MELLLVSTDPGLAAALRQAVAPDRHTLVSWSFEVGRGPGAPPAHDAALVDLREAPERLALLRVLRHPIALGPAGDFQTLVEACRQGARDYAVVPPDPVELTAALARVPCPSPGLQAAVEYRDERGLRQAFALEGREVVTLGRDPANDIYLPSAVVSRFHARIESTAGGYRVLDSGSRHGTVVNDERLEGPRLLRDGDSIRLGKPSAPVLAFALRPATAPGDTAGTVPPEATQAVSNRELRDLASLLDTFLQLSGDLVLDEVLALVLDRIVEFAGAERGLILLLEENVPGGAPLKGTRLVLPAGQVLHLVLARDEHGTAIDPESLELEISKKIPEEVLATGKGKIVEDLLARDEAAEHLQTIELGVRSAMGVPLLARLAGREVEAEPTVLGVLYVDSRGRARPFSPQLMAALESLATEAAQAIASARLYQVSVEKRRIDEEMRIAREIQSNLLPPGSFASDWVELEGTSSPSREVGGDLLNYYPIGGERLGLLVGDVSGKGIAAAIFSAMLDGHFQGLSTQSRAEDLEERAGALNRYLVGKSRLQKFVSFVFGLLDRRGELLYINAGHNPPLHLRAGGEVSLLRAGGMVMGMFDDARYGSGRTRVDPGDVLVLYSDGITEARGPAGELFSLTRLREVALAHRSRSAREIHAAILEALGAFVQGAPRLDDVTLLVVKRLREAPGRAGSG